MSVQRANLKAFLNSAIVDPKDRKNPIQQTIIEEGTPQHFEFKAIELLQEAGRLRTRIEDGGKPTGETLIEFYLEKLRLAATNISLAAAKMDEKYTPIPSTPIPPTPIPPVPPEADTAYKP